MAASAPLNDPRPIVGALVLGDGYLRFCRSTLPEAASGDWVVVDGPLGSEPGRIVFGANHVDIPPTVEIASSIARVLPESEISDVAARAHRALALIDEAKHVVAEAGSDVDMTSLRFNLDGTALFCTCSGVTVESVAHLEQQLSKALGYPVRVEWHHRTAQWCGSLGRVRFGTRVSEAEIRDRLGVDVAKNAHFPQGWPRLGSKVATPAGTGRLIGIAIRHNTATIRLESGDEAVYPVEELAAPTD